MKKFEDLKTIYDTVFKNLNGYSISLFEKQQKKSEKYFKDVVYGETPFELLYAFFCIEPMANLLKGCKNFYDLGSGIGNSIIGAYLVGNFEKCVGIELLDGLYEISLKAKQNLISIDKEVENKVELIHDNILNVKLGEAEAILFCCPNMDEKILEELENKLINEIKNNCFIMSIIYPFKNKKVFKLLESRMVKTAWGEAPLFLYKKVEF